MSHNETVGGYTEDTLIHRTGVCTGMGNCFISVYSSIQGKFIRKTMNTIDSLLSNNIFDTHSVVGHKSGALIRAVIMSQKCTQPSMEMFPNVS